MTKPKLNIEIRRSPINEQFYFHLKARNGKLVLQSEGYKTKQACVKTAKLIAAAEITLMKTK